MTCSRVQNEQHFGQAIGVCLWLDHGFVRSRFAYMLEFCADTRLLFYRPGAFSAYRVCGRSEFFLARSLTLQF